MIANKIICKFECYITFLLWQFIVTVFVTFYVTVFVSFVDKLFMAFTIS